MTAIVPITICHLSDSSKFLAEVGEDGVQKGSAVGMELSLLQHKGNLITELQLLCETTPTYNSESFYAEHEDGELDDLVYEVRRVDFLAGGLKVQHQQVV